MHAHWHNFLQQHGAQIANGGVVHFGDPAAELRAAERGTALADLSQEGLIRVEGPDACTFLQGQLSTDVLSLTPTASQLSSWSNAKGRVVTLLWLFKRDGVPYISLPQALTAPVIKRLGMYVLRAKAKLADASDTLARFGCAGLAAQTVLTDSGLSVPAETNAVTLNDGIQLIRLHGTTPRFALHGDVEKLARIWETLVENGAQPVGNDPWSLLRILAREPVVYPGTSEHFVAQMLGLEELGAINFKKGCYPGQEVIARAHYRGAVKRHLHRAQCSLATLISSGAQIHSSETGQAAGEVVNACRDASGNWQMLIVLQDESSSAPLHINDSAVSVVT